jgi:hypothetical protein
MTKQTIEARATSSRRMNEADVHYFALVSCARQQAYAEAMSACDRVMRRFLSSERSEGAVVAGVCHEAVRLLLVAEEEDLHTFAPEWECRQ